MASQQDKGKTPDFSAVWWVPPQKRTLNPKTVGAPPRLLRLHYVPVPCLGFYLPPEAQTARELAPLRLRCVEYLRYSPALKSVQGWDGRLFRSPSRKSNCGCAARYCLASNARPQAEPQRAEKLIFPAIAASTTLASTVPAQP